MATAAQPSDTAPHCNVQSDQCGRERASPGPNPANTNKNVQSGHNDNYCLYGVYVVLPCITAMR